MLVYNTQDYTVLGLCPLSGILKDTKEQTEHTGCPVIEVNALVGVYCLSNEGRNRSSFQNVFFCVLKYQMMDEVQKPSNPE
jgi:hypothetical protein